MEEPVRALSDDYRKLLELTEDDIFFQFIDSIDLIEDERASEYFYLLCVFLFSFHKIFGWTKVL